MARAQGCEARRITTHAELLAELDERAVGTARTPLLLEITVAQDESFDP